MPSILYQLYTNDYDISTYRDDAEETISKEIIAMLDKVKEEFGREFADQLAGLYIDREIQSNYRSYREGFRLGVRLMLEAFTPA